MQIKVTRYNSTDGSPIGEITAPLLSFTQGNNLYGGCLTADLTFNAGWNSAFVAEQDEEIIITNDGVEVFSGRVEAVEPVFGSSRQELRLNGWWKRLDEAEIVTPLKDRITFGEEAPEGADATLWHPEVTTVYGVFNWLFVNIIQPQFNGRISLETLVPAPYTCKLAGPFAIHANESLTKVLETLAMMDDCVVGITARRGLYWVHRGTLESSPPMLTAQLAKDVPANWRTAGMGVAVSGSFIQERMGPTVVAVHSRDVDGSPSIRTYNLLGALDGAQRIVSVYRPGIRTGVQARRYARGAFRRYSDFGLKVNDLECYVGPRRFEPHLGPIRVMNGDTEVSVKLAGNIRITWLDGIRISISLGETRTDPGSGDPVNDPFAPEQGYSPPDMPQVDTGDGLTNEEFPLPSADIDLDDDFDGDGDDFHQNEERVFPTDPTGGMPGVDYGSDRRDNTNGQGGGPGGLNQLEAVHWMAYVTGAGSTAGRYNIKLLYADMSEGPAYSNVVTYPPVPQGALQTGQGVLCFFPMKKPAGGSNTSRRIELDTQPVIDSAAFARSWPARIVSLSQLPYYRIALYAADLTTVIAYFDNVPAWPAPAEAFSLNDAVWVNFPSGGLMPVIIGHKYIRDYGIGNGPECNGHWGAQ